ncbi:hypothetical protein MAUB1S_04330 [Mycolicibacterium aubagnense]
MQNSAARVSFDTDGLNNHAHIQWPGHPPLLADVCAMFESFGLRVASYHYSDDAGHCYEFGDLSLSESTRDLVAQACEAAIAGRWNVDRFAMLIAAAGIDWRRAVLVRAACRFVRQTGLGLSEDYIVESLVAAPEFVNALLALFNARFNPDAAADIEQADREVTGLVDAATSLDDDRIRRALHAFVGATLRTNWFQVGPDGRPKDYVSFKIDSSRLSITGPVVPYREIFVHSDAVEGVHLRSGAIARGGLRWSNRAEDFRTEVLGLMKTQAVKNAPIVPTGAKGAFVLRSATVDPAEGYRTFIRGLLDVTDNIVDGAVRHPDRTVCPDGEDAYLVVAADKGTATFSDLANAIAAEYGFWLGDAFASGGSAGYDHKAMGITARGAWLSVRRHFAEAGHDIDVEPFTVAGIGDMSGDVFGNGMLLSRNIKLVAAFDHRHIFLDPNPDPAASYQERARLFALPRSSWQDYNPALISSGGGVWSRTAKSIPLSDQTRARLGITAAECTPNELINAVLRAPVDLLWNGGVGTYVRADDETDADAQDKANDRVRITASQLRCKVIGEGGNLGLTQQARIAFALNGGRVNADFIDNAAGVATSDLEVNPEDRPGLRQYRYGPSQYAARGSDRRRRCAGAHRQRRPDPGDQHGCGRGRLSAGPAHQAHRQPEGGGRRRSRRRGAAVEAGTGPPSRDRTGTDATRNRRAAGAIQESGVAGVVGFRRAGSRDVRRPPGAVLSGQHCRAGTSRDREPPAAPRNRRDLGGR